jgi:hypothetical protein
MSSSRSEEPHLQALQYCQRTAKGPDRPEPWRTTTETGFREPAAQSPFTGRLDACCMHLRIRRLQVRVLPSALL